MHALGNIKTSKLYWKRGNPSWDFCTARAVQMGHDGLKCPVRLWRYKGFTKLKAGKSWTIDILKGDYFHPLIYEKRSFKTLS